MSHFAVFDPTLDLFTPPPLPVAKTRSHDEMVEIRRIADGELRAPPPDVEDPPLPVERVDVAGFRFCRNHPGESIPRAGYPCALCRKAGEGLGELVKEGGADGDE